MHWNSCFRAVAMVILLTMVKGVQAQVPYEPYSVEPWIELQPGFTAEAHPELVLDLAGVGREALEIHRVSLNGQALSDASWKARLNLLTIKPDRAMRVGLNRIELQYSHPLDAKHVDNPVTYEFYVNHQPHPTSVELGRRGELIIAGKPTFVVGSYRSGQEDRFIEALPSAQAAGFNMVHDYRFDNYFKSHAEAGVDGYIRDARQYLERAHELGMGVFLGLPRDAVSEYDEEILAHIIAELSGEPALWLWYIRDEPTPANTPIVNAARTYHLLKRLDPNRPAVILPHRPEITLQYEAYCDLLWYDRYPIIATSDELRSMAPISALMQHAKQIAGEKPVWPVLQAHDFRAYPGLRKKVPDLPMPRDEDHRPNEAELRAQAHLGIANGSMGLVYYWGPDSWYSMRNDTPGVWASLSKVLQELRGLEPILLSTQAVPLLQVTGGNDKVLMWTRALDQSVYVGLVNTSSHQPSGTVSIQPSFGVASTNLIVEEGSLEQSDTDGVQVTLPKAGVMVIELQKAE